MRIEIGPGSLTDDRPPTLYFKIKTHKPYFITNTTSQPEIYTYNNGPKELTPIARPIINHRNSITTHTSTMLRKYIKPIITNSKYLTKDIHETISILSQNNLPDHIYTGDIEAFYPSTPHSLVLEAFSYYHHQNKGEKHILRQLLAYNYAIDGKSLYYLGTTGIPMGLPLAPELARMCTAYLLRDYVTPPNQRLTVYFDDVASTFPIEDLPLAPYNLKPTPPNTTQDCTYDPTNKKFLPLQQKCRQPVLLHPLSYHPSAFRASKTSTDPSDYLDYLINKYLPPLVRSGHNATETATKLAITSYFPTPIEKREWEYKPIIRYTWSDTRPNRRQLQPLELKDFHLIPILPLAPLKYLLAYQSPKPVTSIHGSNAAPKSASAVKTTASLQHQH